MNDQVTALKIHVEKELNRLLGKAWVPECSIDSLLAELEDRVRTTAQTLKAQESINNAIGFEFLPNELQSVNAHELLKVYELGRNAGLSEVNPHILLGDIAAAVVATSITKNYHEVHYTLTVEDDSQERPDMIVTIQLKDGKTPHEKREEAEERCTALLNALMPFAVYRRVKGDGIFLSVGGGGGHAEIDSKHWDKALTVYDGAQ